MAKQSGEEDVRDYCTYDQPCSDGRQDIGWRLSDPWMAAFTANALLTALERGHCCEADVTRWFVQPVLPKRPISSRDQRIAGPRTIAHRHDWQKRSLCSRSRLHCYCWNRTPTAELAVISCQQLTDTPGSNSAASWDMLGRCAQEDGVFASAASD